MQCWLAKWLVALDEARRGREEENDVLYIFSLLVTAFPDIDERLAKIDENPLFRGCSRLFRQPCMGVKVL